jgi:hypothetical protein
MTDASNGWPDPSKPGVPLNPERDGWHWVETSLGPGPPKTVPRPWKAGAGGGWDMTRAWAIRWYRYLGPCLTPAEVAAREAAAAQAMREQIAEWISKVRDYCIGQRDAAQDKAAEDLFDALARDRKGILDGIALMPLPDTSPLAAMLTEARREGMRRARTIAENVCDDVKRRTETPRKRAREDGHLSEECHQDGKWHGAHDCQEEIAAAILAAAKEVKA